MLIADPGTCGPSWTSRALQPASSPPGKEPAATRPRRQHSGPVADIAEAGIQRRKILGGLIHEYERAA
jgi:hypothetical protein